MILKEKVQHLKEYICETTKQTIFFSFSKPLETLFSYFRIFFGFAKRSKLGETLSCFVYFVFKYFFVIIVFIKAFILLHLAKLKNTNASTHSQQNIQFRKCFRTFPETVRCGFCPSFFKINK